MDLKQAEEHASLVARDLVTRGLASQEVIRKAYFEYVELIRKSGVRGTFPQLLIARKLVDAQAIAQLASARPPSDRQTAQSGSQLLNTSAGFRGITSSGSVPSLAASPLQGVTPPPAFTPAPAYTPQPHAPAYTPIDEPTGTGDGAEGRTMQIDPQAMAAKLAEAATRRGATPPPAPTPASLTPPPPAYTPGTSGTRRLGTTPSGAAPVAPGVAPGKPAPGPTRKLGAPPTESAARPGAPARTPAPDPARESLDLDIPPSSDNLRRPEAPTAASDVDEFVLDSDEKDVHRISANETQDEVAAKALAQIAAAPAGGEESVAISVPEDDEEEGEEVEVPEVPLVAPGGLNSHGEPPLGAKLGKYEIVSQLGRGGMAVVFKVRDTEIADSSYAMKVLTGGDRPGAEKRRARFRREVRAVQRLDHENIVKIRDSGRSGPIDFYVMDLVEGEDFEKALQKGRYELEKRLEIMERICRAMSHAHERGVIHRDLKPQNVLLDLRAKPKVVDFGLAKVRDDALELTRTNTALGTPFYMSPEQHKNAKNIDQRSDVFALGVMIYECATGVRPFTGETAAEVGHKVLTHEPPPPSKVKPGVPYQIDAIAAKAMEKDPARRYATAGALLVDLIRARAGKELLGAKGSAGAFANLRRWAERNRGAVIGGAVVAGVFLPIIGFLGYRAFAPPPKVVIAPTPTPTPTPKTTPTPGPTPASTPGATPGPGPTVPTPPPATPTPAATPTPGPNVPPPPPVASASPTPPPPPKPPGVLVGPVNGKPATPLDLARSELKIPEENAASVGADALAQGFRTPTEGLNFIMAYDRLVATPLARGDLDAARDGVAALPNDSEVANFPKLAREELAHDLELLAKLRRVVVEHLRAERTLTGNVTLYDVSRTFRGPAKLVEEDLIELQGAQDALPTRVVVEPLALSQSSLKLVVGNDPDAVLCAIAVLGAHRGEDVLADLKSRAASPYVSHRIAWLDALRELRAQGLTALEKPAEERFRDILSERGKAKAGLVESLRARMAEFLTLHGRFETYRVRRPEFLRVVSETIPWERLVAPVVEDKKSKVFDIHWAMDKKKHVNDFEVAPWDPKKPYKAELGGSGVWLENAGLSLFVEERVPSRVAATFVSSENEPVILLAGDRGVELDVRSDAVLRELAGTLIKKEKATKYNLRTVKTLELSRTEEKDPAFVARLGKDELLRWVIPKGAERPNTRQARIGFATADRARVVDLETAIAKTGRRDGDPRAPERDLIEQRVELLRRGSRTLVDPHRVDRELVYEGSTTPGPKGIELIGQAPGNAAVSTVRELSDGECVFEVAADDGPGVMVELLRGATPIVKWELPGTQAPNTNRKIAVTFELAKVGGTATCVIDEGLRLETKLKVPPERVSVRISTIARTRAIVKNLKVIEVSRPK